MVNDTIEDKVLRYFKERVDPTLYEKYQQALFAYTVVGSQEALVRVDELENEMERSLGFEPPISLEDFVQEMEKREK